MEHPDSPHMHGTSPASRPESLTLCLMQDVFLRLGNTMELPSSCTTAWTREQDTQPQASGEPGPEVLFHQQHKDQSVLEQWG